jgi:hypothetical protein
LPAVIIKNPTNSGYYPAASSAELWRELPNGIIIRKLAGNTWVWLDTGGENSAQHSINPADALAELLIWVRRE